MNQSPTSDEKILAALAHGSVLISFLGPIGPTIIWAAQRKKSKYVTFHALQAMGYQAFSFWLWIISMFIMIFGILVLTIFLTIFMERTGSDTFALPFIIQPLIILGTFGLLGIFFLIGLAGAIFCMMDREFQYPIIGKWLKKKMLDETGKESNTEEWEDNWVSGICHSTAILQLWGIITPLIVWITQKERSAKVRFQALQAIFYQLIATIVYISGTMAYFLVIFLFMAVTFTAGTIDPASANRGELPSWFGIVTVVFIIVILLFLAFYTILGPLYHLLAMIASIRTIRGHEFKYPVLGRIIASRIKVSN